MNNITGLSVLGTLFINMWIHTFGQTEYYFINVVIIGYGLYSLGFEKLKQYYQTVFSYFTSNKQESNKGLLYYIKKEEERDSCKILIITDKFWEDGKTNLDKGLKNRIIDMDYTDEEWYFRWFNRNKEDEPKLKIIIHSAGGEVKICDMIFGSLINYDGQIDAYIPYYAFSAAAMVTLACDNIFMDQYGCLGPTDPQMPNSDDAYNVHSSRTVLDILRFKRRRKMDDKMCVYLNECKVYHKDNINNLKKIFQLKGLDKKQVKKLVKLFGSGIYPHHRPIYSDQLTQMGLEINSEIPEEINKIFEELLKFKDNI